MQEEAPAKAQAEAEVKTRAEVPAVTVDLNAGDWCETCHSITVQQEESVTSDRIGHYPKGTAALILKIGDSDKNRVLCEFPTYNGVHGWISIYGKVGVRRKLVPLLKPRAKFDPSVLGLPEERGFSVVDLTQGVAHAPSSSTGHTSAQDVNRGDWCKVIHGITVREGESTDSPQIGYYPKGTAALVLEVGTDKNRIRCHFPTKDPSVGWMSILDKKQNKPLLEFTSSTVAQGAES